MLKDSVRDPAGALAYGGNRASGSGECAETDLLVLGISLPCRALAGLVVLSAAPIGLCLRLKQRGC